MWSGHEPSPAEPRMQSLRVLIKVDMDRGPPPIDEILGATRRARSPFRSWRQLNPFKVWRRAAGPRIVATSTNPRFGFHQGPSPAGRFCQTISKELASPSACKPPQPQPNNRTETPPIKLGCSPSSSCTPQAQTRRRHPQEGISPQIDGGQPGIDRDSRSAPAVSRTPT